MQRRPAVPADVLVRLYAAALEPDFWVRSMRLLAPLFGCAKAMVAGIDHNHPRDSITEAIGFSPETAALLVNRQLEDDYVWQASTRLPVGKVYRLSDLALPEVYRQGPLHRRVAVPEGLDHFIATIVESRPEAFTNIIFLRGAAAGDFTAAELGLMAALAPHLQAAVALAKRVSLGDAGRREALRSFDRAGQPLVVLDRSGYAIHVNDIAVRLLGRADGVTLKLGRFLFDSIGLQAEFERLVRETVAMRDTADPQPAFHELRVPRRGPGSPLALSVVPCVRDSERAVLPPGAGCLVLIYDADVTRTLPVAQLQWLYRVTPAELRVCEAIFSCGSVEAAAEQLFLSRNTVRSHLKSIYAKFGVANQGQLLQRLANSLHMVAAGDAVQKAG